MVKWGTSAALTTFNLPLSFFFGHFFFYSTADVNRFFHTGISQDNSNRISEHWLLVFHCVLKNLKQYRVSAAFFLWQQTIFFLILISSLQANDKKNLEHFNLYQNLLFVHEFTIAWFPLQLQFTTKKGQTELDEGG